MWNRAMVAAVVIAAAGAVSAAQEIPAAPVATTQSARAQSPTQVGVKVQVVISRFRDEKKIASLPYTLGVVVNGAKTSLRMGVDVPVISTVFASSAAGGPANIPQTSYNYRSVGTNIDCQAEEIPGGYYRLQMTVTDSSIQLESGPNTPKPPVANAPMFRSFNSSFQILLRDGQTTQYTAATDPVNGEVTKIDVTLNVLK